MKDLSYLAIAFNILCMNNCSSSSYTYRELAFDKVSVVLQYQLELSVTECAKLK